jgi:DNA-binding transcriptional MerR regulator
MADTTSQVEIPNRALFKAAEVCDLAKVQPYVLRSWEAEFKDLGFLRNGSTARVYRREDVERVLRIKHLLLIEGLTLAGVRRRLEEEAEPPLEEEPAFQPVAPGLTSEARERIVRVRHGLRSLLDLLEASPSEPIGIIVRDVDASDGAGDESTDADFLLTSGGRRESAPKVARRSSSAKDESGKSPSPRRKRPA